MYNPSTFAKHLDELRKYLGYLKELQRYSKKDVLDKWHVYGLIERYLHLAIECSLSLGEQIISNHGFRLPDDYKDVIYILAENKVIPKKFAQEISGMAGFRNILVHGYAKINRERVYEHLHKDTKKLKKLAEYLAKFA